MFANGNPAPINQIRILGKIIKVIHENIILQGKAAHLSASSSYFIIMIIIKASVSRCQLLAFRGQGPPHYITAYQQSGRLINVSRFRLIT